ncbi:MAG: hypothetical protein ACRDPY_00610 [Streptosporangiaceae bacterium]
MTIRASIRMRWSRSIRSIWTSTAGRREAASDAGAPKRIVVRDHA